MSLDVNPAKPLPLPDSVSEGFWRATAEHVLAIQRCTHCRTYAHPPGVVCRACLASVPAWRFEAVSGRGRIQTWTVFRQSFLPGFKGDVPYVIVDVELAEQAGLRILGKLVDGPNAKLSIGTEVETVFEDTHAGLAIPQFKLARGGS
jgi:uncharacterized OB-fold protein